MLARGVGHARARAEEAYGPSYPEGCAAPSDVPCQRNTRGPLSKLRRKPPQRKIIVTSKSQLRHISCHTDKNRYYT